MPERPIPKCPWERPVGPDGGAVVGADGGIDDGPRGGCPGGRATGGPVDELKTGGGAG